MCTAMYWNGCFGRTLDLDRHYHESVTVTPRQFPLRFSNNTVLPKHYAMIGMATVAGGYPLYYEATNERGLSMAGLHFPDHAVYRPPVAERDNVASYELIPWVLAQCATLAEAQRLLAHTNVTDRSFSEEYPPTPLHWLVADQSGAAAAEPLAHGLQVEEDPLAVLTNAPPLTQQMTFWDRFSTLSPAGGHVNGLPGDWSSPSRFVRAAFVQKHAAKTDNDNQRVAQFFHLLGSVAVPRGCVLTKEGRLHSTVYTSCFDIENGVYHYRSYDDPSIHTVRFHKDTGDTLAIYPL